MTVCFWKSAYKDLEVQPMNFGGPLDKSGCHSLNSSLCEVSVVLALLSWCCRATNGCNWKRTAMQPPVKTNGLSHQDDSPVSVMNYTNGQETRFL